MQKPELINSIKSDKEVYTFGEAINIYGELTNNSGKTLRINKLFRVHGCLHPIIISVETKKNLPWNPPPMPLPMTEESFLDLLPGKKAAYLIKGIGGFLSDGPPAPGSYTIQIDYISSNQDTTYTKKIFDAWFGSAESNPIKVIIK
jgi:hypothetical protein